MNNRVRIAIKRFLHIIPMFNKAMESDKLISISQVLSSKEKDSRLNFDRDYYLKLYPDISAAKIDPYHHFVNFGKAEGRRGSPFNARKELTPLLETRKTVLVVSHDASRTGAPILSLNIANELKREFNVVILLLNDGSISALFESACNALINIDRSVVADKDFMCNLIASIVQQYNINFSIVNSIESHSVLEPLAKNFIPSVLLIHEFAAYTRPLDKFNESFLWSGSIVFPAKIVQENASNTHAADIIKTTQILCQGKSSMPSQTPEYNKYNKLTESWFKRSKFDSKPFIILGAGSVHYRKGVDLFIATAAEIERTLPNCNFKMIWVGSGFDPQQDVSYSCYLDEQIKRSRLADCFSFIHELPDLDDLYELSNLFFLSSRLDPLPNVAIDAMSLGKPLICFDGGTGIAEILEKDCDTASCIIPHLSVIAAAQKIIQFYETPEYYSLISSKVKQLAQTHFDMKQYVAKLVGFSEHQARRSQQESLDCIVLEQSDDFRNDFFVKQNMDRRDAIRRYVRTWHSKVNLLRKPSPGFNQIMYDTHHSFRDIEKEPFADYIRSGKPVGPWQEKVIFPKQVRASYNSQLECAIHVHVFYPDILSDILNRIQINKTDIDVYVSTSESSFIDVSRTLSEYKQIKSILKVVPNRGRDLGPLLTEFEDELQAYDVIGHVHTKKSLEIQNSAFAHDWFFFLIENLLGGQHCMADTIINEFKQDTRLGLVFADDPHLLDWGGNKIFAQKIAEELKMATLPNHHFNFPVGTMFWARPKAIRPLFDLKYSWNMYPQEPLPYDGSMLHAIERLIPFIGASQGFTQAVTYVPGLTR
jgi:glycosyltransferase involved in cell wall biosynthesis